jgi:hypothetical protein
VELRPVGIEQGLREASDEVSEIGNHAGRMKVGGVV